LKKVGTEAFQYSRYDFSKSLKKVGTEAFQYSRYDFSKV
jgi:hypothetical protein